jgi:hypothetical protein
MARGRISNLRAGADKAFNKVQRAPGGKKCGTSRNGVKLCVSTHPIAGMKCGRNPINDLYACAGKGRKSGTRRRRRSGGRCKYGQTHAGTCRLRPRRRR